MSPTFASLSIRNYRVWALGALISNVGTWMGRVSQDWVVLTELTDHSASALGIVTGLQFLPVLLLAPWSGAVTDQLPKRTLLMVTQTVLLLSALIGGVLVLTGTAQLWHFYALALLTGVATAFDNPARQTFVGEMVPSTRLPNAVALNSASFNLGRLVGPAVAGVSIAAVGSGPTMLANAATFAAVLLSLAALRAADLTPAPRAARRGSISEGLRYVRGRPDLQLVMLLIFVLGTFGMNFQITIALMATQVFDKGSQEYGLLGSVMAIGSLAAALLAARRSEPRLRVLLLALLGFTVAAGAAALAPGYLAFAVALAACGLTALTAMTTANAMVQMRTDPAMRGRVMALYMAIFFGGTPIGAPVVGWIGDVLGPRWTIGVGAIAIALTLAAVSVWLAHRENVSVSYESARRPRIVVTSTPVRRPTHTMPEAAR
ncbi:MFS transporter [Marihabitans asiaticum]|uniref:Putative MFS family arabinose efflux permease n=1 Tax=Marihabitans asiaticum TaxID=415218 RepID=A0A560WHC0_9MICO|nr:MFS transporter [Marihabitans asiaticum]TWD17083.1 putative MFS family arabinose efflux permease [Marihabitans asiaticum]